jgi:hypothetical protein
MRNSSLALLRLFFAAQSCPNIRIVIAWRQRACASSVNKINLHAFDRAGVCKCGGHCQPQSATTANLGILKIVQGIWDVELIYRDDKNYGWVRHTVPNCPVAARTAVSGVVHYHPSSDIVLRTWPGLQALQHIEQVSEAV